MRTLLAALLLASTAQASAMLHAFTGFTPARLYPRADAWYRVDLGRTMNGAAVSALADQSGSGAADLAQSAAGSQPTYNASDATMGGRESMTFDGTADTLYTAISGMGSAASVLMVLNRVSDTGAGRGWLSLNNGAGNDGTITAGFTIFENGAGGSVINLFRNSATVSTRPHPGNDVKFLASIRFDGTNGTMRINRSDGATTASTGSFDAATTLRVAARFPITNTWANVRIAEVLFLKRIVTDAELVRIQGYASTRYGGTL